MSGTIVVTVTSAPVALPCGLGAAIYISEYATERTRAYLKPALEILAGVPTVIYGYFALVYITPWLQRLLALSTFNALSASIMVGILIVPMMSSISEDALSSVPDELRQAGHGLGGTKFGVSTRVVVPAALSGIFSSFILAILRAIGETAPLIMVGAATSVSSEPDSLFSTVTAMPLQIYAWRGIVQPEFRYGVVAAGVVTLLVVLLGMNAAAILLRDRFERR